MLMRHCMKIDVHEHVSIAAVDFEDGQKILTLIRPLVERGDSVELDFAGVRIFASPFFNGSLAVLVTELGSDTVNRLVKMEHLNEEGQTIANRSIENAKTMNDPEKRKRLAEALEDEDEQ